MTKAEYIRAILRNTSFDRKTQKRIEADLAGDIDARLEAGAEMAQVIAEMGAPAEMAANLLAEMGVSPRKNPWRWVFLGLAVLLVGVAVFSAMYSYVFKDLTDTILDLRTPSRVWSVEGESVGIIGGADGPTAIFVTQSHAIPSFYTLLGMAAACLGLFLLMQWKGAATGWRYMVLSLALLGCALFILLNGLPAALGQPNAAALLLLRLASPAFWGPLAVCFVSLRQWRKKTA